MMAFFLLMWLLGSTTKEEQKAVAGYFNDPRGSIAGQGGGQDQPGSANIGPGGANTGVVELQRPLRRPRRPLPPWTNRSNPPVTSKSMRSNSSAKVVLDALEQQLRRKSIATIRSS
jgi:chemotaxis protein MotB